MKRHNPAWRAFDSYVLAVESIVCDAHGWVTWFIWDNECGDKGLVAKRNKSTYQMKTVKQLVAMIER